MNTAQYLEVNVNAIIIIIIKYCFYLVEVKNPFLTYLQGDVSKTVGSEVDY